MFWRSWKMLALFDSLAGTAGPMGRSLRDISLFFQIVLDAQPWLKEWALLPLPWRRELPVWRGDGGRIRIGIMKHDEVVRPHPPILRGLRYIENLLRLDPSFEVIEYKPFEHRLGGDLAYALFYCDGGAKIRQEAALSGDPILPLTEWALSHSAVRSPTSVHELWKVGLVSEINANR